ncbi:hypothetical protein B0J13DRAFT_638587 [Dactylonectria estremocensis]|uniref:Uncharacterized protein n=1 Tax=Dactylonectria estremocensis TaxID=1079267 RepID=A0A9P9EM72_9HYPO|nr:hypothetical protein B0J13DRAFT_638587 [Dactylonectria estremocensis]
MVTRVQLVATLAVLLSTFLGCYGSDLRPTGCVGSISSFPNCDKVDQILHRCNGLTVKKEIINCFCTQELLNAYVGCKGEFRQCSLTSSYDSALDTEIRNWEDACAPYLTTEITTPSIVGPTRTLNEDTCQTYIESCVRLNQASASCTSSYTEPADITGCRCQSSMISLASVCGIDGSKSCLGETPITSDIWEFRNCKAATEFSGTKTNRGPITETVETRTATGTATTLVFGPTSSAASTTSAGAINTCTLMGSWVYLLPILPLVVYYLSF